MTYTVYNIKYVCQVTAFHLLRIFQITEVHLYTVSFYFQERELEGAQESGNVNVLAREIDKLQTDKREVDNELRRLREEQQAMHMQSTTQAKLDMLAKEKSNKEDAIQKMWEKSTLLLKCDGQQCGQAVNFDFIWQRLHMCTFSIQTTKVCSVLHWSVDSRRKMHEKVWNENSPVWTGPKMVLKGDNLPIRKEKRLNVAKMSTKSKLYVW